MGRIALKVGDVAKIALDDQSLCFARVLDEPLMAFYDMRVTEIPEIEGIVASPILFKVWVMNDAITSGRWPIIGNLPLDAELKKAPKFFKQDPVTKAFSIYCEGKETPATRDECEELERAAVWSPKHIEERLRDFYSGVSNQWVESLKAK